MIYLLALLLTLIVPDSASARSCTRGTDCYRDCVIGPATVGSFKNASCQAKVIPVDTVLLGVEDFEAETLHDNTNAGVTTGPLFGPIYDESGCNSTFPHLRGCNSYWNHTYSNGVGACIWAEGEPAAPALGFTCSTGTGQQCTGPKVWHPTNLWSANAYKPCFAIVRNGEFAAEISGLVSPTGSSGGGSGVFDGQASMAHRIGAGIGNDQGIEGFITWPAPARRTFGATIAMAFPTNLITSGIMDGDPSAGGQMWKFDEWHPTLAGSGGDGLFGFGHYGSVGSYFPFYGFQFCDNPPGQACSAGFQPACQTMIQAATQTVGRLVCDPSALTWFGDTNTVYRQPVDWPLGTWACMRGTYTNLGAANASIKITVTPTTGPHAGQELTVIDISNMNQSFTDGTGRGLQARPAGYDNVAWNAYYNGNFNNGFNHGTVQTTFRYEDNLHIRAGLPVSCAQIGFGGTTAPTVPGTPSNVTVN